MSLKNEALEYLFSQTIKNSTATNWKVSGVLLLILMMMAILGAMTG